MLQTPAPAIAPAAPGTASPSTIYEALTNQKSVLRGQLEQLTDQRADLARQVSDATDNAVTGPARTGMEERIASLDKRIAGVDQEMAIVDAQVSKAASVPGAVVPRPILPHDGPPDEVYVLAGIFMFVFLLPLSIAFARRIWKRSTTVVQSLPADLMARIQRIEQTVESSGIEIERIGEGQRFVTKLLSEKAPALQARNDA
ncbi:MAG: hypothetical protein M3Z17_06115 [Gemmatimonadota bacterium]|nr:hypothetical protein [Gemmatimonadota bacterium]